MSASKDYWITAHTELKTELKRDPTPEELYKRFAVIRERSQQEDYQAMRLRGQEWAALMKKPIQRYAIPERTVELG